MRIRIAYVEEPPFYWTAEDGAVTGADIELADTVLRAIGAAAIEYVPTSFDEFLPGVQERRWEMDGKIDAFAATAIGSRAAADGNPAVEAVAHDARPDAKPPVGAFSFATGNEGLLNAVNLQLRRYLGSAEHRARMAKYGITHAEIDPVLPRA